MVFTVAMIARSTAKLDALASEPQAETWAADPDRSIVATARACLKLINDAPL